MRFWSHGDNGTWTRTMFPSTDFKSFINRITMRFFASPDNFLTTTSIRKRDKVRYKNLHMTPDLSAFIQAHFRPFPALFCFCGIFSGSASFALPASPRMLCLRITGLFNPYTFNMPSLSSWSAGSCSPSLIGSGYRNRIQCTPMTKEKGRHSP